MKVSEVIAKLQELPQDCELNLWCGGDYGLFGVESIEYPVVLNRGGRDPDPIIDQPGEITVRFV